MPTRLDALRRRYVHGQVNLDEFETQVEALLLTGREHEPEPHRAPPPPLP